ncbi:MAG: hypothetical protein EOM50_08680 [Erysipelotrichia bacterium]|nr:hypothetical protein [Erysipelotrichia bacterium]
MIQGLTKFQTHFQDFSDDYVIIGGLATALLMDDYGFLARATKDIDLVVIAKENEVFLKRLLEFIKVAGYQTKQRTDNDSRHNLFRFLNSENKEYPEQIELFAIHDPDSVLLQDQYIIPIETPEYYRYLSAILLDSEYYSLLIEQTTMVDGLHIATSEALILLKMHAHLNLIESPHHYDNKHLKDVIKLSALLEEDSRVTLLGRPKEDFTRFMPLLEQEDPKKIKQILASMNVHNLNKDAVLGILTSVYQ